MCPSATVESQHHPGQMRWEETSGNHLVQPPFQAGEAFGPTDNQEYQMFSQLK